MSKYENVSAYDDPVWGFSTSGDLYITDEGLVFVPTSETRLKVCVPAVLVSFLPFGTLWAALVQWITNQLRSPSAQDALLTEDGEETPGIALRPGYLKLHWECISRVRGGFWGRSLNIDTSRGRFLFTGTVPDPKEIRKAVALRRGYPNGDMPRVASEREDRS